MTTVSTASKLAEGLQYSNITEVSDLAKAYIKLEREYNEIHSRLVKIASERVIETHRDLFQALADGERNGL